MLEGEDRCRFDFFDFDDRGGAIFGGLTAWCNRNVVNYVDNMRNGFCDYFDIGDNRVRLASRVPMVVIDTV